MIGNIIGEPINKIVLQQIRNRQLIFGAGFEGSNINRDTTVINFLSNRNAWAKFASGVKITDTAADRIKDLAESSEVNSIININDFLGTKLAENFVLFNSVQHSLLKIKRLELSEQW